MADAEEVAIASPTPTTSLYIDSLNDVIGIQEERTAVGLEIRIPAVFLLGLYVVALFPMFLVGVHSGEGDKRNLVSQLVLVLIMSVVFTLLVDLDRSQEGFLRVSQQPMIDVQQSINH